MKPQFDVNECLEIRSIVNKKTNEEYFITLFVSSDVIGKLHYRINVKNSKHNYPIDEISSKKEAYENFYYWYGYYKCQGDNGILF